MIHDYTKPLMHYVSIACLLVLGYFLAAGLLDKQHTVYQGPVAVAMAPAPQTKLQKSAEVVALILKNQALAAALAGENQQLSYAQQTIANTVSAYTNAKARLAGALAVGLTQGPPKQQVLTIRTEVAPKGTFTVPSPAPNDDAIKRDMKEVLAQTTVNVKAQTNVDVSWKDKGFSPVSAVYASGGASGAAITLHKAPFLELDALALMKKSGTKTDLLGGFDVEHILHGTSAGVGIGVVYDSGEHRISPQALVHIHF